MAEPILKSLKLTEREEPSKQDPVERAKQKLIGNLREQQKAAEAMVRGERYMVPRTVTVEEDGQRVRKQVNKPIKTWYWRDTAGNIRFSVRVANKLVEIEKGKTDIIVGDDEKLPEIVGLVLKAVEAGELDKIVATAVQARKR